MFSDCVFIHNIDECYSSWRKIISADAREIYLANGKQLSVDRLKADMGKNKALNSVLNKTLKKLPRMQQLF